MHFWLANKMCEHGRGCTLYIKILCVLLVPAMEGLCGEKSAHKTNSIHELEANKHTVALHQGNMNISKANVMWDKISVNKTCRGPLGDGLQ